MNIFQQRPVHDEFDQKLSSLDYYEDRLYVGDEKGNIHKYMVDTGANQLQVLKREGKDIIISLGKGKVDYIKVLEHSKNILVIHDGALLYLDGNSLKLIKVIHKKNISLIEVNQSYDKQNEILAIDKKEKRAFIYKFDTNPPYAFLQAEIMKSSSLPSTPSIIQFYDRYIFIAFPKSKYHIMDIQNNFEVRALNDIQVSPNMFIQVTGSNEVLYQSQNGVGIFLNSQGNPVQKSPVILDTVQQIQQCKVMQPYLIVAYVSAIKVYNLNNGQELQTIKMKQNDLRCLSTSGESIFFSTIKEILYLPLTPYQILIQSNLSQGKVDDAMVLFNSNIDKYNPEREQLLQDFQMNAAWNLIRLCKWSEAKDIIIKNNLPIDPREIISLYQDLLPNTKRLIPQTPKSVTIQNVINRALEQQFSGKKNMVQQQSITEKNNSELFLADIIESRRMQYTQSLGMSMKELLSFGKSDESIVGQIKDNVSLEELLELMDFVLIRIYIKQEKKKDLKDILKKDDLMCRSLYNHIKEEMEAVFNKQDSHQILAVFYESFSKIKEALNIWKEVGTNKAIVDAKIIVEACENTIRILKKVTDKDLILKYFKWVLRQDLEIGAKLFDTLKEDLINPDQLLYYFADTVFPEDHEKEQVKNVKEKYLEVIVLDKKIEEERFHSFLAQSYIEDSLFQIYPKNTQAKEMDPENEKVRIYKQKLNKFLKDPNAKYDAKGLLEKIKDSWLFEETIYLLGKEHRHQEAIKIFIWKQEFDWAEKYCEEKNEKLLTTLFENYIELYKKSVIKNEQSQGKHASNVAFFKVKINNLMKKYATHSQLDQVEVLKAMPSDQFLCDSGNEDGLYSFISATLSHTLHEKRSYQSAKQVSEMDLLNVHCNLIKTKKAFVKIRGEKKCPVCVKAINDKAFVVYPNGVTAHYTCAQKQGVSICPKTGQNFQQTYKGI